MNSFLNQLPSLADLSSLHFLRPLWFLALIPLPWLLWHLKRLDPSAMAWQGLVDAHLLPHLLVAADVRIRRLPLALLAGCWLLGVTALAGPVWERLPLPLYQAQAQRVIVLDLSPDMDAQDLIPSRLSRARFEILDLLAAAAEGQIALLAYGAEPFLVSPLTGDAATIAAQVPDLATALLPVKGAKRTDLALTEAGELLKRAGSLKGDIILITADPERPEAVRTVAADLRNQGFRTSVLGLGTAQGAPIPLGGGGFQSDDQGAIRLSRLQPDHLRAIAAAGGGSYVPLTADDGDTRALLPESQRDPSAVEREEDARADQWREEGPWLLLALLPLAALAFRRGWLSPLTLILVTFLTWLPPPAAQAFTWADLWWRPDQQGAQALAGGDPQQAAALFNRPDWHAAAQYQAGAYDQALAALEGQAGVEADYNRGNALARAGKLQEAVAAYERTLADDPDHADARFNRDLVQQLLAQQQASPSQASSSSSPQAEGDQQGGDPAGSRRQREPESGQGQGDESAVSNPQQARQDQPDQSAQPDQQGQPDRSVQRAGQGPQDAQRQAGQQLQRDQDGRSEQDGQQGPERQPDAAEALGGEREAQGGEREPRPQQVPSSAQAGNAQQDPQDPNKTAQAQHLGEPEPTDPAADDASAPEDPGSHPKEQTVENQSAEWSKSDRQAGAEPGAADLLGGQEVNQPPQAPPAVPKPSPLSEEQQALEAQLRRIPDDPGGLLRQRFLLQHLRRQGQLP